MPKRPITLEDLAQLKLVGDPQLSPDGARVIYTVKVTNVEKNKYYTHLWIAPLPPDLPSVPCGVLRTPRPARARHGTDAGRTASPRKGEGSNRQFTFGEVGDTSPRWSPDGKTVVFTRTKDKQTQIWLIATDGGEPRALTDLPDGAISELKWSPDGKSLAFAFRPTHAEWTRDATKQREESGKSKPPRVITRARYRLDGAGFHDERQHIWVCAVASGPSTGSGQGKAKQITKGDYDDGSPAWSPDSRTIAFTSNRIKDHERHSYRSDIWLVSAKGGTASKVATPVGLKMALVFSPDGQQIAYIGTECEADPWLPKNNRLWVVSSHGRPSSGSGRNDAHCLSAALDRNVGDTTLADTREAASNLPIWSADGAQIFVTVSDAGNAHVYAAKVASGEMTLLTRGATDAAGLTAHASAQRFAVLLGEATRPAEVFVGEWSEGELCLQRVSDMNGRWLQSVQISKPHEFWLTQPDGARVQGWVMRPPDFKSNKKYPLLLYVHGGPHGQYGNTFFHEFQYHAARGYVVVYSNPRGSNGRDEEFGACIHRDWGNKDYADVMAVADYAEALPYVDEKRMAIAGGSYGGFMTNWVVGHANRFACGVTDRSICNWVSMVGTSDFPPPPGAYWPGNPWGDDMLQGWNMSPLKYVDKVRTPLLIIHSEGDLRCPITQSEEWFTALKWLKQEAVFVRYPPETSHGMSRMGPIDLRYDRLTRIGEWLDQHLKVSKGQAASRE